MADRYAHREQDLKHRLAGELEREKREALEKAGSELARLIFEEKAGFSGSKEVGSESAESTESTERSVASADAGERGMKPEERKAPAEHLADILLRGEGVPAEPWRRG